MNSKTVAILGSNSFSGSDFIDLLLSEREYQIIGISRSPEKNRIFLPYMTNLNCSRFTFYQMDLNKDMDTIRDFLAREKPDYIVNFAAQSEVSPSWDQPEQWFQTNTVAVSALGNFLRKQSWLKKYIHISSPEVYGTCEGIVTEDARMNPSTPYAASKASGDLMLKTLVNHFQFPVVMIRSTNVYGAHQQLYKIIPRTIIYLKTGKKIQLHGGGIAVKSYIHIRDVSRGEMAAMEWGKTGHIYHLSPDRGIAIRDLVNKICQATGNRFEKCTEIVDERLGQDKAYVIDSSKARKTFGWTPRISIDEGINGVIKWVNECWNEIKNEKWDYEHKE